MIVGKFSWKVEIISMIKMLSVSSPLAISKCIPRMRERLKKLKLFILILSIFLGRLIFIYKEQHSRRATGHDKGQTKNKVPTAFWLALDPYRVPGKMLSAKTDLRRSVLYC